METLPRTGFVLLIAFASFGCQAPQKEKVADDTVTLVSQIVKGPKDQLPKTNSFDYDKTKVIRKVFVIIKQGAPLRETTTEQANILGHAEFGKILEVVEDLGSWLAIRERIRRVDVKDDGTKVESSGWEKVYVARNETGTLDEIQLTKRDLNIVTSTTINQKSDFFEKGKPLTTHLRLELIDQSVFETQKSKIFDFLLADTTAIVKKNGVITLPTANKPVKINDKPGEEDREEYKYCGQIDFLNQYLVQGSYYESLDFKFFDRTSGKETQSFADYPHISPNRKNIISIYGNPYDSSSDLELYNIHNNQIKLVMTASFSKWFPRNENPDDIFWGNDGNLYLAVIHINAMWGENQEEKAKKQYIRIKLI